MSEQPQSPYFTRGEAAAYLRVHSETISRWAHRLKWQTVYDPMGRVRFLRSEVEAALSATRPPGGRRTYFRKRAMALSA